MSYTEDKFLGGQIIVRQPIRGYRAGMDSVLLSATVNVMSGEKILDVGAGVGTAMLCIAARTKDCELHGLEIQKDLVVLARANVKLNDLSHRAYINEGSIQNAPKSLKPNSFSHVICNPPYINAGHGLKSPDRVKDLSNMLVGELTEWINFCIKMAKPKGFVTFIHRADYLPEILKAIDEKLGSIRICPLWPKERVPAKRVILQGCKGMRSPPTLLPGLILHQENGEYTTRAKRILTEGEEYFLAA